LNVIAVQGELFPEPIPEPTHWGPLPLWVLDAIYELTRVGTGVILRPYSLGYVRVAE
jgi:hypothetical protein